MSDIKTWEKSSLYRRICGPRAVVAIKGWITLLIRNKKSETEKKINAKGHSDGRKCSRGETFSYRKCTYHVWIIFFSHFLIPTSLKFQFNLFTDSKKSDEFTKRKYFFYARTWIFILAPINVNNVFSKRSVYIDLMESIQSWCLFEKNIFTFVKYIDVSKHNTCPLCHYLI